MALPICGLTGDIYFYKTTYQQRYEVANPIERMPSNRLYDLSECPIYLVKRAR